MKKVLKVFIILTLIIMLSSCKEEIEKTILYFDNGHGIIVEVIEELPNTPVKAPKEPSLEGYFFDGWDKDLPVLMPTENVVYYAKWKPASKDERVNAVWTFLDALYYKDLKIDLSKITNLDDFSEFLDNYTYLYKEGSRGIDEEESYVGLGITVAQLNEGLLVTSINLSSPVDKVLYVGDLITSITKDGETFLMEEIDFDDRISIILGNVGEERIIGLMRMGEYKEETYYLKEVNNESVTKKLYDDVGYIFINRFGLDTSNKFKQALKELERDNITNLVIDVRNDGGGYLDAVVGILRNFIVDSNPFLTIYEVKTNRKQTYNPMVSIKKPYNITVLVNENSASASEVLAEALKQEGYEVFGTTTFGKDVFQSGFYISSMYPELFDEGTIINITLGYWYPHDGIRVTNGVIPTTYHPQTGILSLAYPILDREFKLGDSHPIIETYQYLVNLEIVNNYERGLFNKEFETALKAYQVKFGLPETGKLDLITNMLLIDQYREIIKDSKYDNQLNSLLESFKQ